MRPKIVVKGIDTRQPDTNKLYLRQDIDKWYADQVGKEGNRIQLTLFVEALALIQKRPLEDTLSYFRLAAIHCAPWCGWDGVEQPVDPKTNKKNSYCVHNNYTFPTWHRAYMLLYERTLYEAMGEWIKQNVPTTKQKETWQKEADAWRLPYWDFARFADRPPSTKDAKTNDINHDKIRLPVLCMMPNVRINVFDKVGNISIESRPNPLFKYVTPKLMGELPPPYTIAGEHIKEEKERDPQYPNDRTRDRVVNPAFTYPWDKCNATTKYGILDGYNADVWADGGQNWYRANYALNEHPYYKPKGGHDPSEESIVPTLQELVYRMFQYGLDSWAAFSSTRYTDPIKDPEPFAKADPTSTSAETVSDSTKPMPNMKNAMNLEFIHNNVHNFVGGTQFLRPPEEGIHLWGSGHMSSINMAAFDPIFFIYHNNIDRLTAIWQMLNWNKWFDDGYSEKIKDSELIPFRRKLKGEKDEKGEELTKDQFYKSCDVREWRNLGYDYAILEGLDHETISKGQDEKKPSEDEKTLLKKIDELYGDPTKQLFGNHREYKRHPDDFVITVIYDRYALNGSSYKINLFLVPENDRKEPKPEDFVASIYNFSGDLDTSSCGNCHDQKEKNVRCIAQVPVTLKMRQHQVNTETKDHERHALVPHYMVWNSWGMPIQMDIPSVVLHRSSRSYYKYGAPSDVADDDKLAYHPIKLGKEAPQSSIDHAREALR